jgi:indole-3-glycerol phosphate synthase
MSVLNEIMKWKKTELREKKTALSFADLKARLKDIPPPKPFKASIERQKDNPVNLIAEIKKASPSEGIIRKDFDIAEIVAVYNKKGVTAISVLTDERFFEGSLKLLNEVSQSTHRPVLRKDFIFDEFQLSESRVNGADAVLLIAAVLDKNHLADLLGLSAELSLACLVETHNLKEVDTALSAGADIIGINNRDLNTLTVDLNTTFGLIKDIPDGKIIVSESGIRNRDDVKALASTRVDAVLIGTSFMKAEDIGEKIDELLGKKE